MEKYNSEGYITELGKGEIFVFGGNGQGIGIAGYTPEQVAPYFEKYQKMLFCRRLFGRF